jgi:uncharacterized membrane protein YraQ (UPF0718 family)
MEAYFPAIQDTLGMFVFLGVELSALFLLISFGVSVLQQIIPDEKIQKMLSGKNGRGYVLAALLGSVTPFCSCSTIPMLRGLLKAKVGFGPTLTFLFTSPLLNPIIIGLFFVSFGLKVACIYVSIALVFSILASLTLTALKFERHVIPETNVPQSLENSFELKPMSCCPSPVMKLEPLCCASGPALTTSCCDTRPHGQNGANDKTTIIKFAMGDAWRQFRSVLPYLLFGILVGSLIYGFIPSELIVQYASGNNPLAVPIAAVIGVPLYIRAEAVIPLSAVLAAKGMGLGAIIALIVGSSGASLTEVILLKSMFKMPMVIAFVLVVFTMAVFAGYLFQYII